MSNVFKIAFASVGLLVIATSAHADQQMRAMTGYNNTQEFTSPAYESGAACQQEILNYSRRNSQAATWLGNVQHGRADRVLTKEAAYSVRQTISQYYKATTTEARTRFSNSPNNTNRTALCVEYMQYANSELTRVMTLVVNEANKGNRDLIGTGLNMATSVYNR